MTKYTLQSGQYYNLGQSAPSDQDSTIEIEIIQRTPGPQARVTFAVWERVPCAIKATAQGSATVPVLWLERTLEAHRAYLMTERAGENDRAEYPDPVVDRRE